MIDFATLEWILWDQPVVKSRKTILEGMEEITTKGEAKDKSDVRRQTLEGSVEQDRLQAREFWSWD